MQPELLSLSGKCFPVCQLNYYPGFAKIAAKYQPAINPTERHLSEILYPGIGGLSLMLF